jgi:hypothetical protein
MDQETPPIVNHALLDELAFRYRSGALARTRTGMAVNRRILSPRLNNWAGLGEVRDHKKISMIGAHAVSRG